MSPSSSGLGRRPFTAETRVRFPLGTPTILLSVSSIFIRNQCPYKKNIFNQIIIKL